MRFWPLVVFVVLAGCGGQKATDAPVQAKPPNPVGEDTGIFVKGIAEKFDNQGRPIWRLSVKSGSVSVSDAGAKGSFEEFEGSFHKEGKPVAWVKAASGSANSAAGIVTCAGGVEFVSKIHRTEIVAERLEWRSKQDLIIASGNVEVRQGDFYLGKCAVVFADTAAGQVWLDSKEARMTLKTVAVPLVASAIAVMGAQQVRQYGSVTLSNFTSFRIDLSDANSISAVCKGSPARLVATDQGLDVSAETIEANLTLVKRPGTERTEYVLTKATASGKLRYELKYREPGQRASRNTVATTIFGTADKAVYDRIAGRLVLTGRVVATIRDPERFEDPGLQNEADECVVIFEPETNRVVEMELTSKAGTGRTWGTPKTGGAGKQ